LARAADRIKFLLHLPEVNVDSLMDDLSGFLSDPLDVQIMVLMLKTTCQSEVAKQLGVSQGLVRHRFLRSIGKLEKSNRFGPYVFLFRFILDNLNILREVQRPMFYGESVLYSIR
jgi:hypothetical protein